MKKLFEGYYKKTAKERLAILAELGWSDELKLGDCVSEANQDEAERLPSIQLKSSVADQMIENYVFNYSLPLGVAVNFNINGEYYAVPMVIEEPSVIAAASNGAKRLGNIQAWMGKREVVGQIILHQVVNPEETCHLIEAEYDRLLSLAKAASPNMVKRGGGPTKIWTKSFANANHDNFFVTVYVSFDPCDAMGANSLNTVLESLKPVIETTTGYKGLMSILSNYATEAIVRAKAVVPVVSLNPNPILAEEIAQNFVAASHYAQVDTYRAATHNKGIMNGIDAVAIATGNDWRAIEAGAHAYAAKDGQYRSLSDWSINLATNELVGTLELPLQVATVGGTITNHPTAQWSLELLRNPTANHLAEIIASVGLAQNYSALYALVTDGIQKGHMGLQARSLALQVGASIEEVPQVVTALKRHSTMNSTIATDILIALRASQEENT